MTDGEFPSRRRSDRVPRRTFNWRWLVTMVVMSGLCLLVGWEVGKLYWG